jgi:AAA ATPase domain
VIASEGIVGRDRELAIVAGLVARATAGGGALLIRGDAGIGKSALVERAVLLAEAAGMHILRATGVRTEANLPFAGLHQLLRPILGGLETLPKPQYTALAVAFGLVEGTAEDPFLIALATLTLLADSAANMPILIVADDVQWLDRPSADAVAFVARRLGSDPLVMVVELREGEDSPFDAAGVDELVLPPLSDRDARDMVSSLAPGLAPAVRERILREAAGDPLALAELSATIRDDPGAGDGLPDVLPLPARLEREFAARAAGLSDDTQWLLLVAALDDRDGVAEILAAAGVPSSAITPALDARLIAVEGPSLRFRHPLIRSAIQQRATPEDQRAAHGALAGVLGDFDRAAWHRAAAAVAPDEPAAALLDAAAGRAIRRGALTIAIAALLRAAALSADGRGRGTRLLRAADVANEIGRVDVIGQLLETAKPIDARDLEDRRQAWLMALALTGPRSPREEANLRSVVAAARRAGEDGEADLGLALLQFATSRCWWIDPGVEIRSGIAAAGCALAPAPDDVRGIYTSAIAPEGRIDEILALLAERSATRETVTGPDARRLATAALWVGALDLAVDFFIASDAALRNEGRLGLLARSLIVHAYSCAHLGMLTAVGSYVDEGVRLVAETRQPFFVATGDVAHTIYLAFRGDIAGAEVDAAFAVSDADIAEADAYAALDNADWAVENARVAILDAIDARVYANEKATVLA